MTEMGAVYKEGKYERVDGGRGIKHKTGSNKTNC